MFPLVGLLDFKGGWLRLRHDETKATNARDGHLGNKSVSQGQEAPKPLWRETKISLVVSSHHQSNRRF